MNESSLRIVIGDDEPLPATALTAIEQISHVPLYRVLYAQNTYAFEELIGQRAEIWLPDRFLRAGISARRFVGIVTAVEVHGTEQTVRALQEEVELTIQPELALLSDSIHSTAYHNKTSIDLLEEVLARNGLSRSKLRVNASPPRREFCLQYQENDLAFVMRILSEDGIAFYFGDPEDPELLVLQDSARPYPDLAADAVRLRDASWGGQEGLLVEQLKRKRQALTGRLTLTRYSVARATTETTGAEVVEITPGVQHSSRQLHLYSASGDLQTESLKRHAGAERAQRDALSGLCHHPAVFLGQALHLDSTARTLTGEYRVSSIEYTVDTQQMSRLLFTAVPRVPGYVPPILPRPVMRGVHNAIVTGGEAGEPVQDAEGRVRVRFIWDSIGPEDASSYWLRVATPLAGNGYGAIFTPRAGQEVIVSFLDGDPDSPLITGSVFNGRHQHPWMGENSTVSGWSSLIHQTTGNALSFDDNVGEERLMLQAARDLEVNVTHAAAHKIAATEDRRVGAAATHEYQDTLQVTVAKEAEWVAETLQLEARQRLVLKVGDSRIEITSSGISFESAAVNIRSTSFHAEGNAEFSLSGGTGQVEASGPLTAKALQVTVDGSVLTTVKAGGILTLEGSGMTTVKGGIVSIN